MRCDGSLSYWIDTLDMEYVQHYLADVPRWKSGPLFFGYFLLGSGGIAALGLLWALRRDAWQQTVATITLLYLLIVLGSGFKNLHWLAPLWPIPLVLFLMPGRPKELVGEFEVSPSERDHLRWKTIAGHLLAASVPGSMLAEGAIDVHAQPRTRPAHDHCHE